VISPGELAQRLAAFPRAGLGSFPTPLERWERLGAQLGLGDRLLAKREDLSGLAFGGNKVRQLDLLLGDALAAGADTIVHGGALQSNYCRVLSAACARLGLDCQLVLSRAYGQPDDQGNVLLDLLAGATVHTIDGPLGAAHEAVKAELTERLRAEGRRPYLITYPRSETLGTVAFVEAALETLAQCDDPAGATGGRRPELLLTAAVGSAQAGCLLGARALGWELRVRGIAPLGAEYPVVDTIADAARAAAELLGLPPGLVGRELVDNSTAHVGDGYAAPTAEGLAAIRRVARAEGVFLDPVYTGKAMAALIADAQDGTLAPDGERVLFLHTGGNVALFAYAPQLLADLEAADGALLRAL
jgi:1-aminocyclopropane-1-carboxylate deaminase/D-cysteine desulfhydrase-like pyridoxal-dependent ACC family enzyme